MNLAVKIPEYYVTSLTISRNCNSVWNVCLNPNVNIHKCIKVSLLAHLHTRASLQKFITQTSSAQAAIFFLSTFVNSKDTLQMTATLKNYPVYPLHTHTHTHTHLYLLHNLSRTTYSVVKRTPLHTHAYF